MKSTHLVKKLCAENTRFSINQRTLIVAVTSAVVEQILYFRKRSLKDVSLHSCSRD